MQHLNERKLQQALLYAIRPSRPKGTPRLQGLYIFGPKDSKAFPRVNKHVNVYPPGIAPTDTMPTYRGVTTSQGAQIGAEWNKKSQEALENEVSQNSDMWFGKCGKIYPKLISLDWASTIHACQHLICFDAILCHGRRHFSNGWSPQLDSQPYRRAATYALEGCSSCKSAPEGLSKYGVSSIGSFPLLAPVPLHSSTTKSAKAPFQGQIDKKLLVRCIECLKDRYCESCRRWWCENCYEIPNQIVLYEGGSWEAETTGVCRRQEKQVKVHMGLCVENCLVGEMMSGAGSNGMWG